MEKKIKFKKAPNFKIPSTDGKIFELNKENKNEKTTTRTN